MSADTPVTRVPYRDDPLRQLAALLLERHADRLPDLSRHVVLFPHVSAIPRFRRLLREQAEHKGFPALLPPYIGTPYVWVEQYISGGRSRLGAIGREILLLDLLNEYPRWRRHHGEWALADSLLELFDELTLYDARLHDSPERFIHQVCTNYGMTVTNELSPMSDEARMVHTLWHAWQARLAKVRLWDPTTIYLEGLRRSLETISLESHIYMAGFVDLAPAERRWAETLSARKQLTLFVHANTGSEPENPTLATARAFDQQLGGDSTSDAYSDLLDRVFATNAGPLRERAARQAELSPRSPARGRLTLHQSVNAEAEARAVELQVRRWIIQGVRDIGVITHDRRLARRVRALLERAGIGLVDAEGWALSTTSAATVLARWLECIEQDFAHRPLLDLLKSPFLKPDLAPHSLATLTARFERDVVRTANVSFGLEQYRRALDRNRANWDVATRTTMSQWIDHLNETAAPLIALRAGRPRPATDYLDAFRTSLDQLGLTNGLQNDDAGRELLSTLAEMRAAAHHSGLRLGWPDFVQWLRRTLEQCRFRPRRNGRGVELMGFVESRLYRFDALILAGAIREHLPGPVGGSTFFTDSVRSELGLPSFARRNAAAFQDFRRLLEAAPRVLISLRREQDGERLAPSPWVERVRTFHELAYLDDLSDPELEWLARQSEVVITDRTASLPSPVFPPAPALPAQRVPPFFTASDCQRLVDCPYQFFAARGLGLEAEDEVREEIEKRDYGERIHRILQAFHIGVPGLPGPWAGRLDDTSFAAAETLLRRISEQVFSRDLKRRYLARGWLYRWEECIPAYLRWERQRAERWTVEASEIQRERTLNEAGTRVSLTGRIDRTDRNRDGRLGIVDYKTGAVPNTEYVLRGENTQLPFYALLLGEEAAQAFFLTLDRGEVKEQAVLDEATLNLLCRALGQRLVLLRRGLEAGAPLPACGDLETCKRCDKEGLCRRGLWQTSERSVA